MLAAIGTQLEHGLRALFQRLLMMLSLRLPLET
jgi:hypothetical protein